MLRKVGIFLNRALSLKERVLMDASRKLIKEGEDKAAKILLQDVIEENPSNKTARQLYAKISTERNTKSTTPIDPKI